MTTDTPDVLALREARSRLGLTLREAAPRLGIDFTYLSKVENGHERPSDALLLRMCDLYGLEPDAVVLARAVAEVPAQVRAALIAAVRAETLAGPGVCGECPHAAHTGDICDTERPGFITGCPCRTATPPTPALTAARLAQMFHEAYERLAPDYGYKTREATAVPWPVPEPNYSLMVAVAGEVLAALATPPAPAAEDHR